jgi:hypothetical protein
MSAPRPTLWEIGEGFAALVSKAEDLIDAGVPEAEALAQLRAEFDGLEGELAMKCEGVIRYVRTEEALAAAAKEEARRLSDLAKTRENKVRRMKDLVRVVLAAAGTDKVTTPIGVVAIQKNGGKPALVVDDGVDIDALAETCPWAVKTTLSINNDAVRERLATTTLEWARLVVGNHVKVG